MSNYRGGISAARIQALKDISQHQTETAPTLPWAGPRSCEIGFHCWTASQLRTDTFITHLNRQIGL